MKDLSTLNEEAKLDYTCNCLGCPTFVECGEKDFCQEFVGKSKHICKEKGCLCPGCPVQEIRGTKRVYYCSRGPVKYPPAKK
jgi:hypothetical protein